MSSTEGKIEVRPMNLKDTDAILSIDKEIRAAGKAITYANLTTEYVLSTDRKASYQDNPTSYVSSITGNVAALLDFSFVAEADGQVRGFILGQLACLREAATDLGVIQMIGVHPKYQRKGIGAKLVNALADKYRSKGIKIMRIGIDHRDKSLLSLVEDMGFGVGRLIVYAKIL
ncbi:MAG: GNAT family N-acetyltransferase [Dehalococcoidia bacterium]|nr:GNAT family N-acetyltransferase [Dehalococcoidia bacterium]